MMWRYLIRISPILMFLVFVQMGCSHHMGNKAITDENSYLKIEKGVTTKQQILSLYGKPTSVNFTDNNEEVWIYYYSKSSTRMTTFIPIIGLFIGGMDTKSNTLTIRYGEDGIVKAFGSGAMHGGGGGLQDIGD